METQIVEINVSEITSDADFETVDDSVENIPEKQSKLNYDDDFEYVAMPVEDVSVADQLSATAANGMYYPIVLTLNNNEIAELIQKYKDTELNDIVFYNFMAFYGNDDNIENSLSQLIEFLKTVKLRKNHPNMISYCATMKYGHLFFSTLSEIGYSYICDDDVNYEVLFGLLSDENMHSMKTYVKHENQLLMEFMQSYKKLNDKHNNLVNMIHTICNNNNTPVSNDLVTSLAENVGNNDLLKSIKILVDEDESKATATSVSTEQMQKSTCNIL